jgi:hypothetical protein
MKDMHHHHHHHELLRLVVHERIKPYRLPLHAIIPKHLAPKTCGECHQHGGKYIMEHSMGLLKEMCGKAAQKECRMAKVCGMMAKKPEVTMGMMIEHVRPLSLTSAYCFGKGSCKPDNETMAELELGMQPHDALLDNFDQIDWSNVLDEAGKLGPKEEHGEEKEEETDDKEEGVAQEESFPMCEMHEQHHPNVCPKCMKHTIKHVMKRAVWKVVGMCKETSCPKKKKLCGWAREHKGVAFGMLVAKVEPWKFALGHCAHKKHHGWGVQKFVGEVEKTLKHMGSEITQMIQV